MSALAALQLVPRLRRARTSDVPAMATLINRYAERGLMLPKTTQQLARTIGDYVVFVDDAERLAACGGLRVYSAALAEIVGLAVEEGWQGRELGSGVVGHLVARAEEIGIHRLFAMTLSEPFFHRLGFETIPRSKLPEKEESECRGCPRRVGCREIAVERRLGPPVALRPRRTLDIMHNK